MTANPTPLQLMDRLLDALEEAGIGWCKDRHLRNAAWFGIWPVTADNIESVRYVCMAGALIWGHHAGVISFHESERLKAALTQVVFDSDPRMDGIEDAVDGPGWDFARFREELARREGEHESD